MRAKLYLGMLLFSLLPLTANHASAQEWAIGGYGLGGNWASPYGWNTWAYTPDFVGAPPYFSVRPPVYYRGAIVRRSYGDSPFPYSTDRPVEAAHAVNGDSGFNPEMIINPYVSQKKDENQQAYGWKLPQQQLVDNPYR